MSDNESKARNALVKVELMLASGGDGHGGYAKVREEAVAYLADQFAALSLPAPHAETTCCSKCGSSNIHTTFREKGECVEADTFGPHPTAWEPWIDIHAKFPEEVWKRDLLTRHCRGCQRDWISDTRDAVAAAVDGRERELREAFTVAAVAWMAAGHAYKKSIDSEPSFGGPWPKVTEARDVLCEAARVMDAAYDALTKGAS